MASKQTDDCKIFCIEKKNSTFIGLSDSSMRRKHSNNFGGDSSHSGSLTLDVRKLTKQENGYVELCNLIMEMIDVLEDETKYIQCIKKLVWIEDCRKKGIAISHFELEKEFELNHKEPHNYKPANRKGKAKRSKRGIPEKENNGTENKPLVGNKTSTSNFENRTFKGKLNERIGTRKEILRQWEDFNSDKESIDFFVDKVIDLEEQFVIA